MTTDHFDIEQLKVTVRQSARILVVDDDSRVRWTVERQLRAVRSEVVLVESGAEALDALEQQEFSVLLTDERMPGMSGTELLAAVRERFPDVVRIMMTGDNDVHTAVRAINAGEVFRFVMKPWSMADLHQVVKAGLAHHAALKEREVFATELERANAILRGDNEALEGLVQQRTIELRRQAELLEEANAKLAGSLDASLRMLGAMMGLGNHRVTQHCDRTRERVAEFARELDLSDGIRRDLELAAQYHWLGLLAAPPEVFECDPVDHSPDVAAIWEFHPTLSSIVLSPVEALERPALIIEGYMSQTPLPEQELAAAAQALRCCSVFEHIKAVSGADAALDRVRGLVDEGLDRSVVSRMVGLVKGEVVPGERRLESVEQLEPGMVLSRMVTTYSGLPMEPAFRAATPQLIERLCAIDQRVGLGEIWVREG